MRLWPRKRYGVFAYDKDAGVIEPGGPVYQYVRFSAAASMAGHLTVLASVRHGSRRTRPPLQYVVRAL